jgi:hypothetical protein
MTLVSLGAAAVSPLVHDLGVCVVAAALLAVLFERVRVPTIAALLAAGVAIGPVGLEVVADQRSIETIANLGLTLLLFVIGLEVNLRSLMASGRTTTRASLPCASSTGRRGPAVLLCPGDAVPDQDRLAALPGEERASGNPLGRERATVLRGLLDLALSGGAPRTAPFIAWCARTSRRSRVVILAAGRVAAAGAVADLRAAEERARVVVRPGDVEAARAALGGTIVDAAAGASRRR